MNIESLPLPKGEEGAARFDAMEQLPFGPRRCDITRRRHNRRAADLMQSEKETMASKKTAAHLPDRTLWHVPRTVAPFVVLLIAGQLYATPTVGAAKAAHLPPKTPAASALPTTIKTALALDNPRREGKAEPAQAKRFLTRLLPVTRRYAACRKSSRRHLVRSPIIRLVAARAQFKRLKHDKASLAGHINRRLIRGIYDDLAARAVTAFRFPPATLPGLAVLRHGALIIPSTLANGAIVINEDWLNLAEMGARVTLGSSSSAALRDGLLRGTFEAFGRKKERPAAAPPQSPEVMLHIRAMVADTIAHEMTHSIQLVACSTPVRRWKNSERRRRELEADAGGILLAACAGHPLETLLSANLVMGIMDAIARAHGLREKPYPPWETRITTMFKAVAYVRRLQAKGRWPKGCAPLRVDMARLLKRRPTMAWLKRISTRAGLKAALTRSKP